LQRALESLKEGGPLPAAFRDHQLSGKLRLYREMHIEHDWLLVYKKDGKNLRVVCIWLVNHHDLKIRDRNI
jgi:mRNA interferase YafQ